MLLKGKSHKYGSHVNTDEIIPARYLNTNDAAELASHCMEDIDKDFVNKERTYCHGAEKGFGYRG